LHINSNPRQKSTLTLSVYVYTSNAMSTSIFAANPNLYAKNYFCRESKPRRVKMSEKIEVKKYHVRVPFKHTCKCHSAINAQFTRRNSCQPGRYKVAAAVNSRDKPPSLCSLLLLYDSSQSGRYKVAAAVNSRDKLPSLCLLLLPHDSCQLGRYKSCSCCKQQRQASFPLFTVAAT